MTDSVVSVLDWDSGHFGMPVGRIVTNPETPEALASALESAGKQGLRLVYWLSPDRFVPDSLILSRFGGRRIVGARRYRRPLTAADAEWPADHRCGSLAGGRPDPVVLDLAVLAGQRSRFRLDTRLPAGRFEAMYERWLERSLSGELADDVLVLRDEDGQVRSLVTYRLRDATATIGLVATSPQAQGRRLGSAILRETHRRLAHTGAGRVDVWTQAENEAACRLYEAAGYGVADQGSHYHFLAP